MAGERSEGTESAVELDVDGAESGRAAFVAALRVRRNAKWGIAVGVALAAAAFVLFVVFPGVRRSPLLYVGLGFVLAMSTAGLVAFLLTLGRAVRLSRRL
ncbi:MAG: hypothetical protein ABEJ26_11210 [Halosimplex sp.]